MPALAGIIAAIIAIAQLLGIAFLAYKLERNGAFDAAAVAVKNTADAGGKAAKSGGDLVSGSSGGLVLAAVLIVAAIVLTRR